MSAPGTVLFSANEGYDADMWDDSALIQQYDRALQSSRRELIRRRQEGGSKKKKRDWKVGDHCRAVYSEDGVEYEGSVVFCNKANRSVTVRFFGYNNEEEVKESDLMDSLGKKEIQAQVEQAEADMAEEEEEEGAGDDYRLGDWCRAEWSDDGVVYEAEIVSVDRKKRSAEIKFVGFGNKEVKNLDDLFMSKGEEKRAEQMLWSKEADIKEEVKDDDIENLLLKNCPDLLKNFADTNDLGLENLSLEGATKDPKTKTKKSKKIKDKIKSEVDSSSISSSHNQFPSLPPVAPFNGVPSLPQQFPPAPFPPFPPTPGYQSYPFAAPMMPAPFPSSMPSPFSMPASMLPPSNIPQPPPLPEDLQSSLTPELHSVLLSWYLAGYHSGVYQGISQEKQRRKAKKKSS